MIDPKEVQDINETLADSEANAPEIVENPMEDITPVKTEEKAVATIDENYLRDNAGVGTEEMTADDMPTPILKIEENSSTDELPDGTPVKKGYFFFKGTMQQFPTVKVSFLSFTKQMLPSFSNKEVLEKNYVILGVLEPHFVPFKMYIKGAKVGALKQFLGKVTAMRVPMYCMEMTLATEKRITDNGTYYPLIFQEPKVRDSMEEIVMLEGLTKEFGPALREESSAEPAVIQGQPVEASEDPNDIPF